MSHRKGHSRNRSVGQDLLSLKSMYRIATRSRSPYAVWLWCLIIALAFGSGSLVTRAAIMQDQDQAGAREEVEPAPIPQRVTRTQLDNGIELFTQPVAGVEYTALILELRTGDDHDPTDAPGLGQMLMSLAMTCGVKNEAPDETTRRNASKLNRLYPAGWSAQSYPDHAVLGWVMKSEQLLSVMHHETHRIQHLDFQPADIKHTAEALAEDVRTRFREQQNLIPMSWVVAKAFPHESHPYYGIKPETLERLSTKRIEREWQTRLHPSNMKVHICGDLARFDALESSVAEAFQSFSADGVDSAPKFEVTVGPETQRDRRRRIVVEALPSNKDHVVVAYYAPDITDTDHPPFLAASMDFMNDARKQPGAEARLEFQYSLLLDPRASYLTPHIWRYRGGAKHALTYWALKIKNRKFSNNDGRRAMAQLGWQLGDDLPGAFAPRINQRPALLYTIAYAEAFRSRHGDEEFWFDYRKSLENLNKREIDAARDKYLNNDNAATFVLTTSPN